MRLSAAAGEVGREQAEPRCPGGASGAQADAHGETLPLPFPWLRTVSPWIRDPTSANGTLGEIYEELTGEFSSLLRRCMKEEISSSLLDLAGPACDILKSCIHFHNTRGHRTKDRRNLCHQQHLQPLNKPSTPSAPRSLIWEPKHIPVVQASFKKSKLYFLGQ